MLYQFESNDKKPIYFIPAKVASNGSLDFEIKEYDILVKICQSEGKKFDRIAKYWK